MRGILLLLLIAALAPLTSSSTFPRLAVAGPFGPAELAAAPTGCLDAEPGPFADDLALEFGHRGHHLQDQASHGTRHGSDLEALCGGHERDAGALELLHVREDVQARAAEPVELPNEDVRHPVLPGELEDPLQPWAVVPSARPRLLDLVDQVEGPSGGRSPELLSRERWILVDRRDPVVGHGGRLHRCQARISHGDSVRLT